MQQVHIKAGQLYKEELCDATDGTQIFTSHTVCRVYIQAHWHISQVPIDQTSDLITVWKLPDIRSENFQSETNYSNENVREP